jgi:extracellular factor (EF) 3-hydroxypalmitic acid methyl ester biosynthesis protein
MGEKALKQEGFVVDRRAQKRKSFQERTPLPSGLCKVKIKSYTFEVLDMSTFGCGLYVPEENVAFLKADLGKNPKTDATLFFLDSQIQEIILKFVGIKEVIEGRSGSLFDFEVMGEAVHLADILTLKQSTEALDQQTQYAQDLAQIPAPFKSFVFELRNWLINLKTHIDKLDAATPLESLNETNRHRAIIADNVAKYIAKVIPPLYPMIPGLMSTMSPELTEKAVTFARAQVSDLIYGAPFTRRAFYKPRGYAGDFEMMNHFYRDEVIGKTLFDQCIHKFFVNEPPGAAVKNRLMYLHEKLTTLFQDTPANMPLKILSLASGPAMELQLFLKTGNSFYNRPVEFTCLDQDTGALEHAQLQIYSLENVVKSNFQFKFNNTAIRNVIASGLPENDYDLIYSAGLFDYLMEPVARTAAQKMLDSVKPGGRIIIGNFGVENPWVAFAELLLDWRLIYRSEADLLRIFHGLGSKIWVEKEPLGINLFVVIQK